MFVINVHGSGMVYISTVKPVLREEKTQEKIKICSLKIGGLSIEGHLNYNVRPGEMKMWSLNRGGLSI